MVTVRAAFNHTFVSPPRLSATCFQDLIAEHSARSTTFSLEPGVRFHASASSKCPWEVERKQHDRLACRFRDLETGFERLGLRAAFLDVETVECVVPPWVSYARDVMAALEVTLDGHAWFQVCVECRDPYTSRVL